MMYCFHLSRTTAPNSAARAICNSTLIEPSKPQTECFSAVPASGLRSVVSSLYAWLRRYPRPGPADFDIPVVSFHSIGHRIRAIRTPSDTRLDSAGATLAMQIQPLLRALSGFRDSGGHEPLDCRLRQHPRPRPADFVSKL